MVLLLGFLLNIFDDSNHFITGGTSIMWHAKPSGSYNMNSSEGTDNIFEMYNVFSGVATVECISGIIGNSVSEGGLNPWRWQSDSSSSIPSGGYGLFQYTPGSGYTNLAGATPNMSVSSQTAGATYDDGAYQCVVMRDNVLGKWVSSCWRSYWNTSTYSQLYAYRNQVLNTWGNGSSISMGQFFAITDIDAATFVMLACFEGPAVPNLTPRQGNARQIYEILTGQTPPGPDPGPDPPTPPPGSGVPWWLIKKCYNNQHGLL